MLIGRDKEIELLNMAINDSESHFIAIYGRRRIGKTYLVREACTNRLTFQHSGLYDGGMSDQIFAFTASLSAAGYDFKKKPQNWLEAFEGLKELIRQSKESRKIIFIDELSWMDTPKSNLIMALENFWNGFASARKDVILICCSSATAWMISKVIHNKGGLYNRLTEKIALKPFSLRQCEDYVHAKGLVLNREQILQYYMIFGGVPYYWTFLKKGLSLAQNIDEILFSDDAALKDEFKYLYSSIFKNPDVYYKIVQALGSKKAGMTREEIIDATHISNSGDLTLRLEELESCGFIRRYNAYGMKKKNALYQLIDNYTLFYFKYIKNAPGDEHFWSNSINTPSYNTWCGFAFERVCLEHIRQIKRKLGISGVLTEVNSWFCKRDPEKGIFGSQIDMLIVRKDQVINLCEMKYSVSEYTITVKDENDINKKINDLVRQTGTGYAIFPTLVTTKGLVPNTHSGMIQSVVTLNDLFEKEE